MSDLYWLTDELMARLEPYFPKSHGKRRVDDRRVLSGIIFRQPQRPAPAGCAGGLWATQDPLQSLEAVEPSRRLCPDDGGTVWSPD